MVNQNIFGFETTHIHTRVSIRKDLLSIHDVHLVNGFQCQQDRRTVKLGRLLFEPSQVRQVKEQFAPIAVVQHKINTIVLSERVVEPHYERVLNHFQNTTFGLCVLDLVFFFDHLLLKDLHRIQLICLEVLDQQYFAICSSA